METNVETPFSRLLGRPIETVPQPPAWPMAVDDFLIGDYMRWSDICLSRNEYNPLSWLIRRLSNGNFAHVALVFLQPNWRYGWQSTYLLESVFSGVEVTDLYEWLKHPRLSVAVRRLNADWFDDRVRRRVRGKMLDDIKAEYAFSTLFGLGRQLMFGVESAIQGHKRAVTRRLQKGINSPKEFICSGFVQRGYVQGVHEFIKDGRLPPSALREVVFDTRLTRFLPDDWQQFTPAEQAEILEDFIDAFQDELWAVTPRDIETHPGLDWVYVIHRGKAYQVSSYAEVCEILKMKPFALPRDPG